MTGEEATAAVIDALGSLDIPYMLVGSLSSNYYGVPRSTQDADFVVQLRDIPIGAIAARLGPQFRLEPQLSFEMIQATTRYVLWLADIPFHVELFLLSDDEYDRERFSRRRRVSILGREVYIPTAEDVIVTKLRWSQHGRRIKDRDDVRNVLAIQSEQLDWNYLELWCSQHGTKELLDEILKSLPKI
jgi:hypothetical protein